MATSIPLVPEDSKLYSFLKSVGPFQALTDQEIKALAPLLSRWEYRDGEVIFQAGEIGTEIFIIEEGGCCLEIAGRTVKHLNPGDLFGEIAVIDALPRTATVKADPACRLLTVKARDLEDGQRIGPAGFVKILKELARKITSYVRFGDDLYPGDGLPAPPGRGLRPGIRQCDRVSDLFSGRGRQTGLYGPGGLQIAGQRPGWGFLRPGQ